MPIYVFYPYFMALMLLIPLFWYWIRHTPRSLSPRRRRLLTLFRLMVFILLVGGLVRISLTQPFHNINVVFLLDLSHSIDSTMREQALGFIQAMSEYQGPRAGMGLVVFGGDAYLEQPVSHGFTMRHISSQVDGSSTNIARAIQVGLSSFPAEGARKMVLLSDGNENVASAVDGAFVARALGVEIFPLPLGRSAGEPEVRVEKLLLPSQVRAGAPYYVEAVVFSSVPTMANLELFQGPTLIDRREVTLQPGKNRYRFLQSANEVGVHLYHLIVNSQHDSIPENNRLYAYTVVVGPPKILFLYNPPANSLPFKEALLQQGLSVQARPWNELPHTLSGYLEYDALIFDNVPAYGISVSQMEILERYVRDMGGGLLMLGGENSFGAGGYYRTPLERILPVDMDIHSKVMIPSLALVMVIDKSDSMGLGITDEQSWQYRGEKTTKLEVAKVAAFSAIKLLNPLDQVGLLAFNSGWEWTVAISEAGKLDQMANRLAELKHGGGTDLFNALQEGVRALKEIKAVKKHLLTLSDGLTPVRDFESLMQEATSHNITVTTVGLGKDANRTLMEDIARWGNGRSYYTDNPLYIPRIFTDETIIISRSLIEEGSFRPGIQMEHEVLGGLQLSEAPDLYGYVVTYGKPAAEILMVTPAGDPLLAVQRVGLGRTAAFTSDLSARWGKDWVRWLHFSQFAAQLVRWVQRKGTLESFEVSLEIREGQGVIEADAYDAQDNFMNHLDLQGKVLMSHQETISVDFKQIAPGRYQGRFPALASGEYLVTLLGRQGDVTVGPKTVGMAFPYSSEYLGLDVNHNLLKRLADQTGGKVLPPDDLAEAVSWLFSVEGQNFNVLKDFWPWFVILALCIFSGEIALRQLLLPALWKSRRQRREMNQETEQTYNYDELVSIVHRRVMELRRR